LGIFDVEKDNYDTMSEALAEISISTYKINNEFIKINDKDYRIELSLSGDMVWINVERGLIGCAGKFPCFLCTLDRQEFHQSNSKRCKKLMRTLKESEKLRDNKNKKDRKGYVNEPIFWHIEFDKCFPDTLHEHIRIPNQLLVLTLRLLITNEDKNAKNLENSPIQKNLSEFLQSTGIKTPYRLKGNTDYI
jgi:hypothetical protein